MALVSELVTRLMVDTVGAVVSTETLKPLEAELTLPATSVALVVSVWLPALKVLDVMLQLPLPSAVAVPSTVVPSVSYIVTDALASEVPVNVGVVSLVMSSELETPVSVPEVMSGALGATGAVVSTVMLRPLEATLVLLDASVALAVIV